MIPLRRFGLEVAGAMPLPASVVTTGAVDEHNHIAPGDVTEVLPENHVLTGH